MRSSRVITICMLAFAACGGEPTGPTPLLEELPRELSPAESRVIASGNDVTFALFRAATRALPPDSNAFLSPLSASMALGLALNGANGETFDAIGGSSSDWGRDQCSRVRGEYLHEPVSRLPTRAELSSAGQFALY